MKRQFLILAIAFSIVALVSCSKEKIEIQQPNNFEEVATKKPGGGGGIPSLNLTKGLEGWYRFDGNLVEAYGKLKDADPSTPGADIYTEDRKGNPNSAIQFTGRYGIDIFDIPLEIGFTVAAWVKYAPSIAPVQMIHFIISNAVSPGFSQDTTKFWGVVSTPITNGLPSLPLNDKWHHLVAAYDGIDLKFYVDGNYVGSVSNPAGGVYPPGFTVNYQVGYWRPYTDILSVWNGSVDDLRFYTRVLSASEVQALYNL